MLQDSVDRFPNHRTRFFAYGLDSIDRPAAPHQHIPLALHDVDSQLSLPDHTPAREFLFIRNQLKVFNFEKSTFGSYSYCKVCVCAKATASKAMIAVLQIFILLLLFFLLARVLKKIEEVERVEKVERAEKAERVERSKGLSSRPAQESDRERNFGRQEGYGAFMVSRSKIPSPPGGPTCRATAIVEPMKGGRFVPRATALRRSNPVSRWIRQKIPHASWKSQRKPSVLPEHSPKASAKALTVGELQASLTRR